MTLYHTFKNQHMSFSALSLKPDDPLVLKRRADVLGKLGKREEAIQDYKRAVDIQSHLTGN